MTTEQRLKQLVSDRVKESAGTDGDGDELSAEDRAEIVERVLEDGQETLLDVLDGQIALAVNALDDEEEEKEDK